MKLDDVLVEQAAAAGKIEQAASTAAAIGQALAEPAAAAGAGYAGGKALSKMLGKAVPGVGTGLSLYDAYTRYQNGDYSGAVIATLAGAAYMFGPPGAVVGTALELGNLGRDFMPQPKQNTPRGARGAAPQKEALNPSLSFEETELMDPQADADMDARAVAWGKAWQAGKSTYKDPATGEIKATIRRGAPQYGSKEAFAKFDTSDKFYNDLERLNTLMKSGTKINDPALTKLIPGYAPRMHPKTNMPLPESALDEDWQKVNKRDKTSGMSRKAVKAYRRENPGSKLQTAVTTKPSKLKKGSKSAKRRKSFCARMSGMKKSRASAKTKRDPNSPINKALRRWNCESVEDMRQLVLLAEQKLEVMRIEKRLTESLNLGKSKPVAQPTMEMLDVQRKDPNEYDMEGDYAKTQLQTIERMARILKSRLNDEENLPEWVQTKLARAESMLVTVTDYLISQQERGKDMM
jgi:hypothetical protein